MYLSIVLLLYILPKLLARPLRERDGQKDQLVQERLRAEQQRLEDVVP